MAGDREARGGGLRHGDRGLLPGAGGQRAGEVGLQLAPLGLQAVRGAGFIILDGIRMLCEKMSTLILHFNFYTNIILVFKFIKGILFFLDLNGETRGKNNAL